MASTTPFPHGSIGYLAFPDQADFLLSELQERFGIASQAIARARRHQELFIFPPETLPEILHGRILLSKQALFLLPEVRTQSLR